MKLLALLLTGAAAFAPAVKPLAARTVSQKMMPEALDVVSQMPSQLLSLEVTEAAFMAVVLGTFVPCVFLITLYIQSEAQGTATSFRNPDSSGGQRFDDPAL